jgi:hypothetical protein
MITNIAMLAVEPISPSWGPAVNQLRIGIGVVSNSSDIWVCFENVSETDIVINLGITLANGKTHFPTALALTVTDSEGKTNRFRYAPPAAGIAGRVDPFVVPLPARAVYQIRCPLKSFIQNDPSKWPGSMTPGRYRLAVGFVGKPVNKTETNSDMAGLSLMPYLSGEVSSGESLISIR